jgi:glycine/D-amino acid oxidase-like deaminating enzyme
MRVHDRTSLIETTRTTRGFRLETDRGFHIVARHLIFCTGYESREFIPQETTGSLRSTYVIATEPVADFSFWPEECLVWEAGDRYYYLRTTPDRRVLIGGLDDDFQSPTLRDASISRKAGILHRKLRTLLPGIPWEVYCAWAGTFGETKDGIGYLGEPESFPGAFFVLGYGGNGITYSMIAAQLARDFVLGRRNPDAELFRFGR